MAHYGGARFGGQSDGEDEREANLSSSSSSLSQGRAGDGIRRNYLHQHAAYRQPAGGGGAQISSGSQEATATAATSNDTIHVTLDESYFASERRVLVNLVANCRQKLNSMQMFNPAKNQTIKEQQEQWDEKEKYTLDSLNEIKVGALDDKFQWSRPEDGRAVWDSKLQYFLAITSYSIGLGNVIRFPILVQKNGGLAFVIPFVIMLIVEGIPLFYLELAVGQRMRKAAISCWNLVSPFAAGIGIASAAVSFVIGLYYNTMVAWTLLYLWASASERPLPYSRCPGGAEADERTQALAGGSAEENNSSETNETTRCQDVGSYRFYWYKRTLDISQDVNRWDNFNWPVFLCLLVAWIISYLCLARGLSSSKRVVYVASTFPYVILTIFFFKAISLDGMSDGVYYLFAPEWSKLADPYVWLQAAAQVFFSLGLGFGGLIALSSYNPVNNDCYKDAIKVSLINFLTSIYAGIVIFAILGYKANIGHGKCLLQRDQAINYYLSDYSLKVIDYGAVFKSVKEELRQEHERAGDQAEARKLGNLTLDQLEGSAEDYYDSSDAIASIKSLDRQLDSVAPSGSFDYGDSDTEFIIDASGIISEKDLDEVIRSIPDLPQCSVQRELDESSRGTGLVFVVMAEAISQFKDAPIWATIFFLMLLTLGLDSQFGNLEGLLSSLTDLNLAGNTIRRQWITAVICGSSLIISVICFAHGAGSYMFAIFDEYAASFSLVLIAIFELVAISYIYGLKRFCDDCELMTGKRPPFIILLSWRYISPILLLVVTFATIREFNSSITYEAWTGDELEERIWPAWCIVVGAILIVACVIWIPAVAMLKILKINLVPEENLSRCWFPAEELREFHNLQEEHKVTKLERVLFGFADDD